MGSRRGAVPDSIRHLSEQLRQFRSTHPVRTRLPEPLWQAAVELARQHGIYMVAHSLRLDYSNLQKRLGGVPSPRRIAGSGDSETEVRTQRRRAVVGDSGSAAPVFVELARSAGADEYVIEFESGAGARMCVRWRGSTPEWSSLLRAWREVAG